MVKRLTEFDLEHLDVNSVRTIHQREIYRQYLEFLNLYTDRQWLALRYYFQGGLSKAQVGIKLGIGAKAVDGLLRRAKIRLEENQGKVRAAINLERIKFLKENAD